MERIKLSNIIKNYGDRKIFEISDLVIQDKQKIGIVGKNGIGKSTFLNIISRDIKPDSGNIKINGKISYIRQLDDFGTNRKISGGEKMLQTINLSLQENPDILLADEPSSNLDIYNIEYVTKKFKEFNGTLLLISHDRNILDEVCNYIIEIENGEIIEYKGNYSLYKKQKNDKIERKKFEYSQYIKEKNRLEHAIIASKNSTKSIRKTPKRMGNSEARLHKRESTEIKEKLEGHTKAIETRLSHLEKKEKPLPDYNIYFVTPESSKIKSKNIISCNDFSLEVSHKKLLINTKIYVLSNRKTALLGKNGIGKTTLIKEILGKNSTFSINPQAKIGYFRQDLSILDENISILENVMTDSIQSETTARNVLGNLNIKDNKVYEIVKNLSGGEKVKVALAKLLVSNSNFLILDEPTNFLDIESIEGLELLIKQYAGTVLLISHDKRFVDNVCDNIIIFKDKKLVQFDGNYSEYLKYEENKVKNKGFSNDKLLLEFRLTKLDSKIALENDSAKRLLLEKEREEILLKLKNS